MFRREQERIFGRGWCYAGRAHDLASPGDYVLAEVAGESMIVVRDAQGAVRAYANVCRHRGTRLIEKAQGRLAGHAIQCPYHAWTYGLDGALRSSPGMERSEGFARAEHGLIEVRAQQWDGHVFVNLAHGGASLVTHLGDLPARLRPWGMADLVAVHEIVYSVAANWKLIIQNYSECLHCPIVHPQLQALSHHLSGVNDPPHAAYLGGHMELRPGVASLTEDGKAVAPPLPGLDAAKRRTVAYYAVLPSLLLNLHPDYMMTFALHPQAVDRTRIDCLWYVHPESRASAGFDPTPAVTFWDQTNRQDWQLCERAQRGIASSHYRPGPYANREELLWALDRWVVERL